MKYQPERINRAATILPALLILMTAICVVGCSYFSWPAIVFQPLYLGFLAAAILILSRYELSHWEYGLTEPKKGLPAGKLQVFMQRGKRTIPYCDLDLSMAVELLSQAEDRTRKESKTLPPFRRTFSFVRNLFARDVYYLYIRFRDDNIRLRLEIGNEVFLSALQSRVAEAKKHPPRRYEDEEDEEEEIVDLPVPEGFEADPEGKASYAESAEQTEEDSKES